MKLFKHHDIDKEIENVNTSKMTIKVAADITLSPELVREFEKTNKVEFLRRLERELRLSMNDLGEVSNFRLDTDYDIN